MPPAEDRGRFFLAEVGSKYVEAMAPTSVRRRSEDLKNARNSDDTSLSTQFGAELAKIDKDPHGACGRTAQGS